MQVTQIDALTWQLSGTINQGHFEEFSARLGSSARILVVNSGGGDTTETRKIARLIRERSLDIVVDGICASSCANYLFIAARNKTVLPESLVAFHGGDSYAISSMPENALKHVRWYMAVHEEILKNDSQSASRAADELEFYRISGVSPDLVHISTSVGASTGSWQRIERRTRPTPQQPPDAASSWANTSSWSLVDVKVSWWAPPPDELARLGVKDIKSFWYPANETELKRLARQLIGAGSTITGKRLSDMVFPIID
jgi:hypothetical protein